MSKHNSNL